MDSAKKDTLKLEAVLGRPLKVGYKEANGTSRWFAFDPDLKSWQKYTPPSNSDKIIPVSDTDFLATFVEQGYAKIVDKNIKTLFPKSFTVYDLLFRQRFIVHSMGVNEGTLTELKKHLQNETTILTAEEIIRMRNGLKEKQTKPKGKISNQATTAKDAQANEQQEAGTEYEERETTRRNEELNKIDNMAMKNTKIGVGATFALIGASLGLNANKSVENKKMTGEPITFKDRIYQLGAWGATAAAVIWAASLMWKNGKGNGSQRG